MITPLTEVHSDGCARTFGRIIAMIDTAVAIVTRFVGTGPERSIDRRAQTSELLGIKKQLV